MFDRIVLPMLLLGGFAAHGAGPDGNGSPDVVFNNGFEPCVGLGCFQMSCPGGATTSVSGGVYAPNGALPLPNISVFVPNAALGPLPNGAQCLRCETPPSGLPLIITTSAADGRFVLEDMPANTPVPLVVQSGKWRRRIVIPPLPACIDTPLADGTVRLPRNQAEGDLPRIALSTGGADSLECLLRKTGIDDAEFSVSGGSGRVHLFAGPGGTNQFDASHGGAAFPAAPTALWNDVALLMPYDTVLLSCEGSQGPGTKPLSARLALKNYVDAGGRVYASHWHNFWIQSGPTPWPTLATWNFQSDLDTLTADVNTAFPRGDDLAHWLLEVGATTTLGTLPIMSPVEHTVTAIDESLAKRWIYKTTTSNGTPTVQQFSFTTPVEAAPAAQCGRLVFSDIHASGGDSSAVGLGFPSGGCMTPLTSLTPKDKALIYALFDISRCIGTTRE